MTIWTHRKPFLFMTGMTLLLVACSSAATPSAGRTDSPVATSGGGTAAAPTKPAGGGTTNGGSVDVCALLTQDEVDTAVGQPLGPGKAAIPTYDCSWGTADFLASVTVTVSDWSAIKTAATSNGHTPPAITGVGDEALSPGGGLLYVRKGDRGFLLLVGGPQFDSLPDHGLAKEEVLAAAVLGRF